jgi:hypothetical protein
VSVHADDRPGDDEWWRGWTPPEEDRAKYTSQPWRPGERRWFRSPNVVDLEVWRRRKLGDRPPC